MDASYLLKGLCSSIVRTSLRPCLGGAWELQTLAHGRTDCADSAQPERDVYTFNFFDVTYNISKIDRLTALCQKQETIKLLEEDSAGLMDGTQDSLTGVGKLAEEGANGPGTLRVQSTA